MKLVLNVLKFWFIVLALISVYSMFFLSENVEQFIGSFILVVINSAASLITHYTTLEDKN